VLAAFYALEDFKGTIGAEINLVDTIKLIGDTEALANNLQSDSRAAAG
jgi:hypothetical protein